MSEKQTPAIAGSRDNNFNALRLIFASLVIVGHAPELADGNRDREILTRIFGTMSFGDFAVHGFFLLSGYLILQSWDREPRFSRYLTKRLLRIYPGFFIAYLASALLFAPIANTGDYLSALSWRSFIPNLFLLQPPSDPAFVGSPEPFSNAAMWTISHEFRCYLLVPLMTLLLGRFRAVGWPIIGIALLLAGLSMRSLDRVDFPLRDYVLGNPAHFAQLAGFFFIGGCFYLYPRWREIPKYAALVGLLVLSVAMFRFRPAHLALAIVGGWLLFEVAFAQVRALDRLKTAPDVSYGVYLYGWPVQKVLLWFFPELSPWIHAPITLLIAFSLGYLSWIGIEKPALELKRRFERSQLERSQLERSQLESLALDRSGRTMSSTEPPSRTQRLP